jgi:dTDP-4-amino-4,6-dideoxygalactose transaminase
MDMTDNTKGELKMNPVVLFHPFVPQEAAESVTKVLSTRWIGQGPLVDKFEVQFEESIGVGKSLAVGSGTDALHLAYLLAGVGPGDEVICPVFTCTATNLPLLYIGATPVFADIDPKTMNISPASIRELITEKTKAIVTVDFGGLPCDYAEINAIAKEFGLKVIDDAAHAIGAKYRETIIGAVADFTTYSFQAIKHITTGDGGLLHVKDPELAEKGRRLRWFGIDRKAKFTGIWANDITEIGYKYQMTDIGAAMGIAGLAHLPKVLSHRRELLRAYEEGLKNVPGLYNVGSESQSDRVHSAWVHTVLVENRDGLQKKLASVGIESSQVHYRNDMYSIFGNRRDYLVNMDSAESRYLVLPLHMKVDLKDVGNICEVIKTGW